VNLNLEAVAPKKTDQDDNLIPLINVVFLMLIFFMVAGQISRTDKANVMPPLSAAQTQVPDAPVRINVSESGRIYVNDQPAELDRLAAQLAGIFSASAQQAQFSVQVKADADLPVEHLRTLFQCIRTAGLSRVSLLTQYREEQ